MEKNKKPVRRCLRCKGELKVNYFYHKGCLAKVEELRGWGNEAYNNGHTFTTQGRRSKREE